MRKEKTFKVEFDLQATERVDIKAQEFQQVIVNQMVNADHALSESGDGLIQIKARNWENKGVVVCVQDNGQGVPEQDLRE